MKFKLGDFVEYTPLRYTSNERIACDASWSYTKFSKIIKIQGLVAKIDEASVDIEDGAGKIHSDIPSALVILVADATAYKAVKMLENI